MKKTKKKVKAKKREKTKLVQLRMDRALKDILDIIANGASTDLGTVCQVLIVTGMHMGRAGERQALSDAGAQIIDLQAKLHRCRKVMEVNDPGNARDIFGEPLPPPPPEPEPSPP